jgi:hypothetical protein
MADWTTCCSLSRRSWLFCEPLPTAGGEAKRATLPQSSNADFQFTYAESLGARINPAYTRYLACVRLPKSPGRLCRSFVLDRLTFASYVVRGEHGLRHQIEAGRASPFLSVMTFEVSSLDTGATS